MTRTKTSMIAFALFAASYGVALAQDGNVILQMEDFTCRDLLVRSGSERDFTIAYMHGFMSGKVNETAFDVEKLTLATDAVLDYCIGNPDASILSSFEAARKQE